MDTLTIVVRQPGSSLVHGESAALLSTLLKYIRMWCIRGAYLKQLFIQQTDVCQDAYFLLPVIKYLNDNYVDF